MTIAELRQELEREEKRQLDEQRKTLENEETRRQLIIEITKQRDANRKMKRHLKEKYRFNWQQESSESEADEDNEKENSAMKRPETAESTDDLTEAYPSADANADRKEERTEPQTTTYKRTTTQSRNQKGRFSKPDQLEREITTKTKSTTNMGDKKKTARMVNGNEEIGKQRRNRRIFVNKRVDTVAKTKRDDTNRKNEHPNDRSPRPTNTKRKRRARRYAEARV